MSDEHLLIDNPANGSQQLCWHGDSRLRNDLLLAIPSRSKDLDWVAGTGMGAEAQIFPILLALISMELTGRKPHPSQDLVLFGMETLGLPSWVGTVLMFPQQADNCEALIEKATRLLELFTVKTPIDAYDDKVGLAAFQIIVEYIGRYADDLRDWADNAAALLEEDEAPWDLPVSLGDDPTDPDFTGTFLNGLVALGTHPPRAIDKRDLSSYIHSASIYFFQRQRKMDPQRVLADLRISLVLEWITRDSLTPNG